MKYGIFSLPLQQINENGMKRIEVIISMVALLVLVGCATQQERAERRSKMREAVEGAVANRQFHIDIKSMNSMRYGSRTVTPDFFLELRGDTLRSYLPYLGQAHQAPMVSPAKGLNFEEPILKLTASKSETSAGETRMAIDVKTQEDTYHYVLELYENGQAYIRVNSQHLDPISFDGMMAVP